MDEFVRCPQCDDDLPGEEWEQHLGTHGYFKRPDAAPVAWRYWRKDINEWVFQPQQHGKKPRLWPYTDIAQPVYTHPEDAPLPQEPTEAMEEALIQELERWLPDPPNRVRIHLALQAVLATVREAVPEQCSQCSGETFVVALTCCRGCDNEFYTRDQSLAFSRAAHPVGWLEKNLARMTPEARAVFDAEQVKLLAEMAVAGAFLEPEEMVRMVEAVVEDVVNRYLPVIWQKESADIRRLVHRKALDAALAVRKEGA